MSIPSSNEKAVLTGAVFFIHHMYREFQATNNT